MSPKLLAIVGYVAILLNFGLCFLNQQRSSAPGLSFPRMQQCARTAQPIASLFPLEEHLPVVDNPGSWQRLPMDGVRRGVQGSRMSRST
ncbi:conserved hypothetical protein [Coccidioides posadasii str. Silveira]|uniref:Uncharacterized protein n=2 Tax=Coccidioides posadasii TaxID=199306 RepID=E9CZ99_COCPS|nr:conserved hypothetical protein [Coccidioides posadasii str. Silveira]KMM72892.1 hypothetical protein CPAG_09182 [Coccidioides posadasii RMSCC 3488]